MMRGWLSVALLWIAAGWPLAAAALPDQKLKLLTYERPPYSHVGPNGRIEGAAVEMVQALFARAQLTPELGIYPQARAQALFDHGYAAGIFAVMKTAERERRFLFPCRPLFTQRVMLFVRKDSPIRYDGDLRALAGHSIGLVRGASYGNLFDHAVAERVLTRLDYASHDEWNFRKLVAGRVDVVVSNRAASLAALKKMGCADCVRVAGKPLEINGGYLVFDRKAVDAGVVLRLDRAMAAMEHDGSAERIRLKYGLR